MPLNVQMRPGFRVTQSRALDLIGPSGTIGFATGIELLDGTAASKADLMFSDQRSIAASGSENLDLAGSLQDAFGQTITFVKVKGIYLRAAAANGGNIVLGGAASNAFTGPFGAANDLIKVPAGGYIELCAPVAGWPVTAGTGDILQVANDDGAAAGIYDIVIVGTSA